MCVYFFFLRSRRPPISTRTDTLTPYTTRVRSDEAAPRHLVHGVGAHVHANPHAVGDGVEPFGQGLGRPRGIGDESLGLLAVGEQHLAVLAVVEVANLGEGDRKSTRLNSSH